MKRDLIDIMKLYFLDYFVFRKPTTAKLNTKFLLDFWRKHHSN